jgi:hypothetical protein
MTSRLLRQFEDEKKSISQQLADEKELDIKEEYWAINVLEGIEEGIFVDTSTCRFRFRAQTEKDAETSCAVCLSKLCHSNVTFCSNAHWFCNDCIRKLLSMNNVKCPMCRKKMF